MIHVGASGFSYPDWAGVYYPAGLPATQRLAYYAAEFSAVELNFSYYHMPTAARLLAMSSRAPAELIFTIKAHASITHEREDLAANCRAFKEAIWPWREQGRLGAVLAQFPNAFSNTPSNQDYLRALAAEMDGVPTVVEFRRADWVRRRTFELLRGLGLGICCVDQPPLPELGPPFAVVTSPVGYVRFHGRNAAKWWQHEQAWERYDYRYTSEELEPWAPRIRQMASSAEVVYVFANNHWLGQAIDTARQLKLKLGI
jgi:uncharacterized protein YecE (DUF72 family)